MKVSMKVDYGVRILLDLAAHYGSGMVPSADIAGRQDIPEPYLEQLLANLRRAGFLISKRGPQGGHSLAKLPAEINLGEVIAALEGTTSFRCLKQPTGCERATLCVQRDVWRQIEEASQKLLWATTIAQLAEEQKVRQEASIYYI